MNRRYLFAAVLLLAVAPLQLHAQNADAEKEAVYAVVEKFFQGFNAKDSTVMKSTLFTEVSLFTTGTNQQGVPVARAEAAAQLIQSIASAPITLDERIANPRVTVADGLATVWVDYEFYADGKYSHCGVDVMMLVKTAEGWKISALGDTRRKTCSK
jgi:hypothetical protein